MCMALAHICISFACGSFPPRARVQFIRSSAIALSTKRRIGVLILYAAAQRDIIHLLQGRLPLASNNE